MWNLGSTVNMNDSTLNSKLKIAPRNYSIVGFKISSFGATLNIILSAIEHIGL